MYQDFKQYLQTELNGIEDAGLYKKERIIISPQGAVIRVADGKEVLNFCANNYLGLSNNLQLKEAAKTAKVKTLAKSKVLEHSEAKSVVEKIKDNQSQIKELKVALSDYLAQYVTLSGSNQIEGPDGVLRQIIYSAKLVKKFE